MRKVALVLAAAATLAACGGDDPGAAPEKPDTTPAVTPQIAEVRDLCARSMRAEARRPAEARATYEAFVQELKKLDAPEQTAIQERMLKRAQAADSAQAVKLVHDAYATDDSIDARMGLVDCIWPASASAADAYPRARTARLAQLAPSLDRICADNRTRTARARALASKAGDAIDAGSSERLARLIAMAPRPSDAGPDYGGWTDSLKTVANLYRLAAGTSDGDRATALRAQAQRTAAAARKTAGKLGLSACSAAG